MQMAMLWEEEEESWLLQPTASKPQGLNQPQISCYIQFEQCQT